MCQERAAPTHPSRATVQGAGWWLTACIDGLSQLVLCCVLSAWSVMYLRNAVAQRGAVARATTGPTTQSATRSSVLQRATSTLSPRSSAGSYDVVVIGAGIIGNSCALQLNRKGYRTLNVDKGPAAGSGSTSYSSGNLRSMC